MKSHTLLFTPEMVKAIQAGHKTQTRRKSSRFGSWKKGDEVWVRETWRLDGYTGDCQFSVQYKDGSIVTTDPLPIHEYQKYDVMNDRWRASMHMPRWAARIFLEVQGMRVQRLQEISEQDCLAEGVLVIPGSTAKECFRRLWERIHGPGSWEQNPFLTMIDFTVKEALQ